MRLVAKRNKTNREGVYTKHADRDIGNHNRGYSWQITKSPQRRNVRSQTDSSSNHDMDSHIRGTHNVHDNTT